MKHDELKVGEAYYHDTSTKWREYNNGERVIVDDLTRYAGHRFNGKVPSPGGTYVVGHTEHPDNPERKGTKIMYRFGAFRGTWTYMAPIQKAVADTARRQAEQDQAERVNRRARMERALKTLEIEPNSGRFYSYSYMVTIDELERAAETMAELRRHLS